MIDKRIPIAVANGDGIGPEIMAATLHILTESGAPLEFLPVEIGEKVYLAGHPAGIEASTWETIRNSKAFLKAPITTPQGGGFKSLNVTVRTTLGLYANVRPCVSYYPFVDTKHPKMDVVIVRENEEDLYTGIEYRQSYDVYHALKIITRTGSERIIRYAFEYARVNQRKKVTCFTKDNILKLSDGIFHKVFDEIAPQYPEIEHEHWIIDIGAAKMADTPENFDVIVLPNLYGDILSDVAAQIAGSVGLAGSANIGTNGAMFEAIHGSAPRRAGQNLANPSGLILASVMMLVHLGELKAAEKIHNAWLKTIEEGIHTYDIFKEGISRAKVGTREFAQAVVSNLGKLPTTLKPVEYKKIAKTPMTVSNGASTPKTQEKTLVGLDVFIESNGTAEELQKKLAVISNGNLALTLIGNRGVRVWPNAMPETTCTDQWRCRFMSPTKGKPISTKQAIKLLEGLGEANIDFIKTEHLYTFDGKPGYTLGQDEQ
jgi:isocitrate dehydrogenase